ncbi:DNA gyrase subunit A [Salmonella enterica subsp. enterica serovar Daytona]|uniref:DNA gyrase subunit A n=1 Tax=Salmonella enterica subsp. enterica serovar Daytona TaxID=1962639 RepID=A0A447JFI7_SALET|nr:DNA gyrase subunit A [Salmonella enterica subsp. enterica serovar Daytona]
MASPKIMNLKDIISAFVRHRREVVTRRTIFELRKARDRAHILEALAIALANIDPIIELIRRAPTPAGSESGADFASVGSGQRCCDAGARR